MGKHGGGSLYKRGQTWWLCYSVAGELRRESLGTHDKRQAEAERQRRLAPIAAGDKTARLEAVKVALTVAHAEEANAVAAVHDKLTLAGTWAAYIASQERPQSGPETLRDYGFHWSRFARWLAAERPGHVYLEDVTRFDAMAFSADLKAEGLSPRRFNMIVQTLRRVFHLLAPALAENPFSTIKPQAKRSAGRRDFAEGELHEIMGSAEGELRLLLAVGLYTGLRLGDACTLEWQEINLPMNQLAVVPNKTARTGRVVIVPLFPSLRALLEETPPKARRDYVMPEFAANYLRDRSAVSKTLQAHFHACGIDTHAEGHGKLARCLVGYHSFRHTFVSIAARAGVPMAVVMEIVGHGNPQVTRVYTHVGADQTRAAVNAMPDMLATRTEVTAVLALPPASAAADTDVDRLREKVVALVRTASKAQLTAALAAMDGESADRPLVVLPTAVQ